MFCTKCGVQVPDNAVFCENCGVKIGTEEPFVQTMPPQSYASAPMYTEVYSNRPLSTNPVLNALKTVACSPLFLAAVIAFSAQIFLNIVGQMSGGGTYILNLLYRIIDMVGVQLPYEAYEVISEMASVSRATMVISTVFDEAPNILVCIGLWMIYSSARNRMYDGMKTSGLTMIKVIMILNLIGVCMSLLAIVMLCVIGIIIGASQVYIDALVIVAGIIIAVIIAVMYAFCIVYYVKVLKSINGAKSVIETGVFGKRASVFVAVWSFIFAFFSVFAIVLSYGIFAKLAVVAAIVAHVCFALVIFKYNESLSKVSYVQLNS